MAGPAPTRAYGRRHAARPMAALTALVIALTAVWVVEAPGAVAEAQLDGSPILVAPAQPNLMTRLVSAD